MFSCEQAVAEALKRHGGGEDVQGPDISLSKALSIYEDHLRAENSDTYNARRPRSHLSASMLNKSVNAIGVRELNIWRNSLDMAAGTFNRTRNNLRAAIKVAAPHRTAVWTAGLQKRPSTANARNVVLSNGNCLAFVGGCYRHDEGLGLFAHTAMDSGARPSQIVRLKVEDLQADTKQPKLMMPASGKGGGRNRSERKLRHYPVPISHELARELKAAARGRAGNAPLLLRSSGEPWGQTNINAFYRRDVRKVVESIGLDSDEVTMYALRHTSITRWLLGGTPVRVVASSHDTSVTNDRAALLSLHPRPQR